MNRPVPPRKTRGPKATLLMAIDSWIDSTLYEAGFKASEIWENLTIFFRRFRVTGWKRWFFELAGEGFTMGAAGSIVMLALAMPAFEETEGNWRAQDDFAVTFLDRQGNEIGQRGIIQRESIPVDEMPDHVIKAVLATEDRRFFEHYGIDFIGLGRALSENMRANGVVQGGSSLTQQLAKNLFLSNERTFERKVKEAFLAIWLEANLTKKEILQLYLDRAYMGGGTFGITAAADFYFGKSVKDLNLAEAAMLAGLFKAPAKYAPHVNLPAARARANVVLANLVQGGFMTDGQVLQARLHPAEVVDRGRRQTPDYFLDWAFDEVVRLTARSGVRSMVARTTIDMNLQRAAEDAVEYNLRLYGSEYGVTEGAVVVMEAGGAVRAMVGGRDYGESQFNRATRALRQTGSSFKPYVYAAAMETGQFTPQSVVSDGPINWGGWSPKNYTRSYGGGMDLATAFAKSINTVPVRLAKDYITIPPIKALAEAMGVESPISAHKTMVLGTSSMTVMDQATGYSVFQNDGMAGLRHGITQIQSRDGKVLYDWEKNGDKPRRVLSPLSVKYMNSMMAEVPERGTARKAALPTIRSAGKTGTTQSYRDAWYVGFTGNYLAAVWLGNDDYSATRNMSGGSLPAMVWRRLMAYAHKNVELKPIPGLDQPFVDEQVIAKFEKKKEKEKQEADYSDIERRPVLSGATTRTLRAIAEIFSNQAAIEAPHEPETLSSL
ncbi:MAG: PBP1A family penicillin-binding protein [Mesorhizobium sp.]|nr:PBP1A family penicillin-binding protein [Mesorhizobium sp.]MBL8578993.1 PBP1A family penicillin-binding protein [Mesorhizobium sp.]